MGEKLALCDADAHGELGPLSPALRGLVELRLSEPKGDAASKPPSLLSFSSSLVFVSRKSVFRRRREGGGVDVLGSSRKKRDPPGVGDMGLPTESPVSLRLGPGRPEPGDEVLKFCA